MLREERSRHATAHAVAHQVDALDTLSLAQEVDRGLDPDEGIGKGRDVRRTDGKVA